MPAGRGAQVLSGRPEDNPVILETCGASRTVCLMVSALGRRKLHNELRVRGCRGDFGGFWPHPTLVHVFAPHVSQQLTM